MKSRWVDHKGKRVFIADFSDFGSDTSALLAEAGEVLQLLTKEPPGSLLVITNTDGTIGSPGNLDVMRNLLPISNHFVQRRAILGMAGARKAFLEIYNRLSGKVPLTPFDTMEEALDWIVQE
jgi:hypothetical protein